RLYGKRLLFDIFRITFARTALIPAHERVFFSQARLVSEHEMPVAYAGAAVQEQNDGQPLLRRADADILPVAAHGNKFARIDRIFLHFYSSSVSLSSAASTAALRFGCGCGMYRPCAN